jgi:hypothetical protein
LIGVDMTKDEIIEIAKQVYGDTGWTEASLSRLEAFAALIAAAIRARGQA